MKTFISALLMCTIALASHAQTSRSVKIAELQKIIAGSDSVLVVNFWATFCKPCVHEIPFFQTITEKYKNQRVKLLLVSLDLPSWFPQKVDSFLQENHYRPEVLWLNETNADYFIPKIDTRWSGSIPATYFVNKKTGYTKLFEGEMKEEDFEKELVLAIGH